CLVALVGSRLLHAGRSMADHFTAHVDHDEDVAVDVDLAELEAELAGFDAEIAARLENRLPVQAVADRDEVLFERSFPVRPGDRLAVTLSSEDLVVETGSGEASVTVLGRGRDAREA